MDNNYRNYPYYGGYPPPPTAGPYGYPPPPQQYPHYPGPYPGPPNYPYNAPQYPYNNQAYPPAPHHHHHPSFESYGSSQQHGAYPPAPHHHHHPSFDSYGSSQQQHGSFYHTQPERVNAEYPSHSHNQSSSVGDSIASHEGSNAGGGLNAQPDRASVEYPLHHRSSSDSVAIYGSSIDGSNTQRDRVSLSRVEYPSHHNAASVGDSVANHVGSNSGGGSNTQSEKVSVEHPSHRHSLSVGDSVLTHGSYDPSYPHVGDQLAYMRLSDNKPSAPALDPAYVDDKPQKYHSGPLPATNKLDGGGNMYGYPNASYSGWETNSTGRFAGSMQMVPVSSSHPGNAYGGSMQLVPVSHIKTSLRVLLLHGNLDIWVYEAKNLPNMDMFRKTIGDMFTKKNEAKPKRKNTSDPYVSISIAGATVGRTFVINNDENPVWMQNFIVLIAHYSSEVHFVVKDNDVVGSEHIGTVSIPAEHIYGGGKVQGFYPILSASGKPCKAGAVLSVSIQYIPIEQLSVYHQGVGAGPEYYGVPGTYFPLRKGGTVTLYQDAHVPNGFLPSVMLDNGTQFKNGKCWCDIFDAVRYARKLIYITGWSVWHNVRLVRDDSSISNYTLGELLKSKSQEGVRVLLLVWDDPTSRSILGYKSDGVMQTHDEETRRFFKHSSVQVLLSARVAGKRHSWAKQRETGVIYTHHQKTVIVDADAGDNRRRIMAFVGGLDLCNGRYDNPQHPIIRSLSNLHADDYHNPTYTGNVNGCPREPWHDLHSKIDGPAAYDILTNFEERWMKAAKPQGMKKLKKYDDALLRIERMPEILGQSDAPCVSDDNPESWHVQIFRSIDSNSVKGFPKDPKDAPKRNLVCGKNILIDMSIHSAYVKAIRSAQHFIYIENQYFIGSSYNWGHYRDTGANNLIPMEIALKIVEKIRAHERFAAYIVIPMWPEGNPTGAATQRILFWQHKTMQMMYETIYKALVEVGLENSFSPQDFLNFYCLGNREAPDASTRFDSPTAATNTPQGQSRKNRRFMIYVHSKGMIVDDEFVILGSANINQRSLEGTRDTEIAMGAYQPHHTWATKHSNPLGQVYGYRMSLWAEHIGVLEECFNQPESVECVRRVRQMGEANWRQFASSDVSEMRGHLLKYPVEVDRQGKVRPLSGCETFPDVGGNIVGSFIAIQENLTI